MQTIVTLYLLIGLFNALLGLPNYYEEFFPEACVTALFYLLLWPLQALFKALVWTHRGTGWVLGKVMGS